MSNTPGTVSKILWHFTGGPKWDDVENKQFENPKSFNEANRALHAIWTTKILRAGKYHETFCTTYPDETHPMFNFSEEVRALVRGTDLHNQIQTSKVVCLADIPIPHLYYHAKRYGKFAIGIKREAALKHGFNPVLYTPTKSDTSRLLFELRDELNFKGVLSAPDKFNEKLYKLVEETEKRVMQLLSLVKSFGPSEFESIYCEREWRKIGDYEFDESEVAMIVLPEQGGYFEKFHDSFPELSKNIPVVPWETLIEH